MLKKTASAVKWFFLIILISVFGYPIGYFVLDSTQPVAESDNSPKAGVGVYVINLDRSKERYAYVKDNIHALGFPVERVSGIDGARLTEKEVSEKADAAAYKILWEKLPHLGKIGSYLSHLKALQTFLHSNFEFAAIFEDDVSFDPKLLRSAIEDLTQCPELWDLTNLETHHHGLPLTLKNLRNNQRLAVYLTETTFSSAYVLNRKAAKNLLEKALPMKMPFDIYFTRSWEFGIKFTGIENPRLVNQTLGDSETGKTKILPYEKLSLMQSLKSKLGKLQSYTIRLLYNLKVYLTSPSV